MVVVVVVVVVVDNVDVVDPYPHESVKLNHDIAIIYTYSSDTLITAHIEEYTRSAPYYWQR